MESKGPSSLPQHSPAAGDRAAQGTVSDKIFLLFQIIRFEKNMEIVTFPERMAANSYTRYMLSERSLLFCLQTYRHTGVIMGEINVMLKGMPLFREQHWAFMSIAFCIAFAIRVLTAASGRPAFAGSAGSLGASGLNDTMEMGGTKGRVTKPPGREGQQGWAESTDTGSPCACFSGGFSVCDCCSAVCEMGHRCVGMILLPSHFLVCLHLYLLFASNVN